MISSNILTRNIGSELSTLFLTLKKKISNCELMATDRMVVWFGFFFSYLTLVAMLKVISFHLWCVYLKSILSHILSSTGLTCGFCPSFC